MGKASHTHAILELEKLQLNFLIQPPFGNIVIDENGAVLSIKYVSEGNAKKSVIHLSLRMRKRANTIFYEQIEDFILSNPKLMESRIIEMIRENEVHVLSLHIRNLN